MMNYKKEKQCPQCGSTSECKIFWYGNLYIKRCVIFTYYKVIGIMRSSISYLHSKFIFLK